MNVILNCLDSVYFPVAAPQGCCTKSKQKPRLLVSMGLSGSTASDESVCTTILNGLRKPENGYELNPSIVWMFNVYLICIVKISSVKK